MCIKLWSTCTSNHLEDFGHIQLFVATGCVLCCTFDDDKMCRHVHLTINQTPIAKVLVAVTMLSWPLVNSCSTSRRSEADKPA
eukprot:m.155908 g.155908  ORF g.155908 m.155908 type:complete len:83 (-) comp14311_c0_seq26:1713-1961(-)